MDLKNEDPSCPSTLGPKLEQSQWPTWPISWVLPRLPLTESESGKVGIRGRSVACSSLGGLIEILNNSNEKQKPTSKVKLINSNTTTEQTHGAFEEHISERLLSLVPLLLLPGAFAQWPKRALMGLSTYCFLCWFFLSQPDY